MRHPIALLMTKHYAAKDTIYPHAVKTGKRKLASGLGLTNHQRCILLRSKRMGISVKEYQRRFPKL